MRLVALSIIFVLSGLAAPAAAGSNQFPVKYSVEKGVKVYRNALSPADQEIRDAKLRILIQEARAREADRQADYAKSQMRAKKQKAYKKGYKAGFTDGVQTEQQRQIDCQYCNRRRIRLRQRIRSRPQVLPIVLNRRNLR
jgi:flagellar biosynthesis/type III secretory pathway protein FliH